MKNVSEFGIMHIGADGNRCRDPACDVCNPEDDDEWRKKHLRGI